MKKKGARSRRHAYKKSLRRRLIRRYGGCQACGGGQSGGSRHAPVLEIHHVIPVSAGGETTEANARLLCRPCHVAIHRGQEPARRKRWERD